MRMYVYIGLVALALSTGCKHSSPVPAACHFDESEAGEVVNKNFAGALLASRFESLEDFRAVVDIEYTIDSIDGSSAVHLRHCSKGMQVVSELRSGLSQKDLVKARDGSIQDRLAVLAASPYTIARRGELQKVYILSRWLSVRFGEGDVAFFDLAKTAVSHINTQELAYTTPRDSSEKGYLNTFNHFIAQAIITSCFSEELADHLADFHELHNMPELTHGKFSAEQLTDSNNNPIDNYVDLINNEWGQEMGKYLKTKYAISHRTHWTPELLANYVNDIQNTFSWTFKIGFRPFKQEDVLMVRFARKMNIVMGE